ncbi:MAG TPA: AAA domain-containing protein, partial [Bacillota bacterium]|nr:AAA domain-containing protein [Bacillota bacterium]
MNGSGFQSQIKSAPKLKLPPAGAPAEPLSNDSSDAEPASSLPQEQQATSGNPYAWEFDLCAMTLGNFNYRKMTLVRDYANLIETDLVSEAFDQIFSLEPKPPETGPAPALPLKEQYLVIPCDGTQASAVARARTGGSYIIQGPPGTGKSQTITNLIADYIARGKRVLFVCEKRAAIDVVYYRLRQQGLGELCCLIHDSQADKKAFILNLKQTCEGWLTSAASETSEEKREAARRQMDESLDALAHFSEAMSAPVPKAGMTLRALLQRLIELREHVVELPFEAEEYLPDYADWLRYGALAQKMADTLIDLGQEPCLARHPFRWLHPAIVKAEHPLEMLRQRLEPVAPLLGELEAALVRSGLEEKFWNTLEKVENLLSFAVQAKPLAEGNLLDLLDPKSPAAGELTQRVAELQAKERTHREAARVTGHWREKLPAAEARAALAEVRSLAHSSAPALKPTWWRLRRVLQERYDFEHHAVKPTELQILEELVAEHDAVAAVELARQKSRDSYGTEDLDQFAQRVAQLQESAAHAPETITALRLRLLASSEGPALVAALAQLQPRFGQLRELLNKLLVDFESHSLCELAAAVRGIQEATPILPDLVPVLTELAECPVPFARLLRRFALKVPELEAAVARKTLSEAYRQDRALHSFNGRALAGHMEKLEQQYQSWLPHNTATIRYRVHQRFVDHANVASMSAAALPTKQQEFKRRYAAGRRELEQEFSKTTRFKSIRELAGGNTGEVVRDLKPIWLMSPL